MRLGITISNKFDCSALGFRLWIRQAASRHKKVNKFISSALDLHYLCSMIERLIVIDDVDPVVFYGVNNANMQLIRNLFPKLRIAARGTLIKALGDEEETSEFERKIKRARSLLREIQPVAGRSDSRCGQRQSSERIENRRRNHLWRQRQADTRAFRQSAEACQDVSGKRSDVCAWTGRNGKDVCGDCPCGARSEKPRGAQGDSFRVRLSRPAKSWDFCRAT